MVVTSSRYHQINSAQALKETNRFTRLNADPCSYARVSQLDADCDFDEVLRSDPGSNARIHIEPVSVRVRVRARVRVRGVGLGLGVG